MARHHEIEIRGEVDPVTGKAMVSLGLVNADMAMIRYVPAEQIDLLIARLKSARTNGAMKAAAIAKQVPAALNWCGCEDGACVSPHGEEAQGS
jgi:hypothetical protein